MSPRQNRQIFSQINIQGKIFGWFDGSD